MRDTKNTIWSLQQTLKLENWKGTKIQIDGLFANSKSEASIRFCQTMSMNFLQKEIETHGRHGRNPFFKPGSSPGVLYPMRRKLWQRLFPSQYLAFVLNHRKRQHKMVVEPSVKKSRVISSNMQKQSPKFLNALQKLWYLLFMNGVSVLLSFLHLVTKQTDNVKQGSKKIIGTIFNEFFQGISFKFQGINYLESKLSLLCSHLIIFARKEVLKGSMRKIIWNLDCTEKSFGKWCGKYNSCNSFAASYYLAIVANNMVVVCNKQGSY